MNTIQFGKLHFNPNMPREKKLVFKHQNKSCFDNSFNKVVKIFDDSKIDVLVMNTEGDNNFDVAVCQRFLTEAVLHEYDKNPQNVKESDGPNELFRERRPYQIFKYLGSSPNISDLTNHLEELKYTYNTIAKVWKIPAINNQ